MSSTAGKQGKYDAYPSRNPYPDDDRYRSSKRYQSPSGGRQVRKDEDSRRARQPYRQEKNAKDSRQRQHDQQERSRDYQGSSRQQQPTNSKKDPIESGSSRYYNEDKKYPTVRRSRQKERSRDKPRDRNERSREKHRSRSRSNRRYRRNSSHSRTPSKSRRRYRSRSSRSYERSKERSYSRRSRSYESRRSNDDSRRIKRSSGYDSYYKGSVRDTKRPDSKQRRPRDSDRNPSRDRREDVKTSKDTKDQKEPKDHREQRQQRDQRDHRDYKQHKDSTNKDSRYPPTSKDREKSKVESKPYPIEKDRHYSSNDQREHTTQPNSSRSKHEKDSRQLKSQPFQEKDQPSGTVVSSQGPFLSNPQQSRPPIRIDLEQLTPHENSSSQNNGEDTSRQNRRNDAKMYPQESVSARSSVTYKSKREKQPELPRHDPPKPLPSKPINQTQQLIRSAKALTTFRLPESNFLIIESFRRLDGYEFELEGLTPEWRSKLEDDKSSINLLRSEWLNSSSSNGSNKNSIAIETNTGGPMIPPRHFRLEKSQFINPEFEDRLEQLGDLIRSKARNACETSRRLIQAEVELQALLAKRLQI